MTPDEIKAWLEQAERRSHAYRQGNGLNPGGVHNSLGTDLPHALAIVRALSELRDRIAADDSCTVDILNKAAWIALLDRTLAGRGPGTP